VRLLVKWLVIAAAVFLVAELLAGVTVRGGIGSLLLVAALFAVVNVVVGPVLRLLALPFTLITLGLFLLVVNGVLFAITAALTSRLDVDGFGTAVLAALIISVVTWVGDRVLPDGR
jgi:putative membrane protein